ncbi:hypothetical protein BD413DRAFT_469028 [Trametes elegans]|nr:hypothetical protein BD413DRAFT_469028 [Trametes elegans]
MEFAVIDVSSRESSPARDARAIRAAKTRAWRKQALPDEDVIELTDTDSDELPAEISHLYAPRQKHSREKGRESAEPVAGPSHRRDEPPAAPEPGSAQGSAAGSGRVPSPAAIAAALPLFLPDYDFAEEQVPAPAAELPAELKGEEDIPPVPPAPAVEMHPPEPPAVQPKADGRDPFDVFVAQVLEIVPDVLPAHVYSLVEKYYTDYLEKVVEPVLHQLFENPDYPRLDMKDKGKRKRDDDDDEESPRQVKPKIDYGDKNRKFEGGLYYRDLAQERLGADFPEIPIPYIRQTFMDHNLLYAPTYFALREQQTLNPLPYRPITRPRVAGKGKGVQHRDDELENEIRWVLDKLEEEATKKAAELAEELRVEEEGGIECGCCFCEYPFDKMVQCPEAHLFCVSCMTSYSESKLGAHDAQIVCMDQSGCKLPFPESELRRFLTPRLLELYERVKQRKEIEAAGLENLEECPFCEYKVVIENDLERLFRCEDAECGAVTCRKCKKPDHLPKSCEEVTDDKKLDVRHAIEEAMTRALMRNCPKCAKAFVKEYGCNKMTCPNCQSLSCYVCRKLISGYEHFANPPPYTAKADPKKCPLWDTSVEGRHSDEVTAAAKQALEEFKRTHPELDAKDLAVDLPPPPPPAAGPSRGAVPVARMDAHAHALGHLPGGLRALQAHGLDAFDAMPPGWLHKCAVRAGRRIAAAAPTWCGCGSDK